MKSNTYIIATLVLLHFICCHSPSEKNITEQTSKTDSAQKPLPQKDINTKIRTLTQKCAVMCYPDSLYLDSLEKHSNAEEFATTMDDYGYYISEAVQYLNKKNIKQIKAVTEILAFKKADGTLSKIDFNNREVQWEIYLFDGKSEPKKVGIISFAEQADTYFK